MSKAVAKARSRQHIYLRQLESPFSVMAFVVHGSKTRRLRIDNLGPFDKTEALRLARWITDTFEGTP